MLEFYQQHKLKLENELKSLYDQMMNAGIATRGDYLNRIVILEPQLEDMNKKIATVAKVEVFKNEQPEAAVRVFKLFLASSSELKAERDQFEIFINRENNRLINQKKFLRLTIWEDFIDAMSQTRLQDEYNKAIKESDVFVSLFSSKAGPYTEEEFNTAVGQFKENGKPLVYTYFKDTAIDPGKMNADTDSLLNFKNKLKSLGHFYTSFNNIYDLKYQFKMQLDKILPLLN